jgi:hypothetical protein
MISERVRFILEDLEQTQLQFIRKHKIPQDEYRCATDTLVGSGAAGEGSLLYDVFLKAAARSARNIGTGGSLGAIEGPFYLPSAPGLEAPYVLPQRSDEAGVVLFFRGCVKSSDGAPLAGGFAQKKKQRCPRPNTKSDFMRIIAGLVRLAVCDERHFKSRAFLNRIRMEIPIDGTSITLRAEGRDCVVWFGHSASRGN